VGQACFRCGLEAHEQRAIAIHDIRAEAVLNTLLLASLSPLIAQIGAMATYSVIFYLCNRFLVFR
tara:strand:- start:20366 stop:20560 length:195 start_codon:yes stop_codon:yes gene_type:complete